MTSDTVKQARVLYVAGQGRTGSTVLGRALGGLPGVTFVGELNFFWRRFANGELCGCGQVVAKCPFWSEVVSAAFGDITPAEVQQFVENERHVLRRYLLPGHGRAHSSRQIRAMLDQRARLYAAIAQAAGTTWIVDTGKDLRYGGVIACLDDMDVATIHLVRDPRGVAFSWLKHVRSDSEPGELERRSAANSAAHWLVQNLLMQWGLRKRSGAYIRVRYEDFVTCLPDVIRAISSATGLIVPSPEELAEYLAITPAESHLVAGNPGVRAQGGVILPLTLDEEWRVRLPRQQRWIVTAMCAGLMTAYGYPLGRSANPGTRPLAAGTNAGTPRLAGTSSAGEVADHG